MKLHFRNTGAESHSQGVTPLLIPGSASGSRVVNSGNVHGSAPGMQPVMPPSDVNSIHSQGSAPLGNPATRRAGPLRAGCLHGPAILYILGIVLVFALPFAMPVAYSHAIQVVDRFSTTVRRGFNNYAGDNSLPFQVQAPLSLSADTDTSDVVNRRGSAATGLGNQASANLGTATTTPAPDDGSRLGQVQHRSELVADADQADASSSKPSEVPTQGASDFREVALNPMEGESRAPHDDDAAAGAVNLRREEPRSVGALDREAVEPSTTLATSTLPGAKDSVRQTGMEEQGAEIVGESVISGHAGGGVAPEAALLSGSTTNGMNSEGFVAENNDGATPNATRDVSNSNGHEIAIDRWVPHVEVMNGRLLMARTFERRLNADVAPTLAKSGDELWGSSGVPCIGSSVEFSFEQSPKLEAQLHIVTNCGPGKSCVITPTISDFRRTEISVGDASDPVHFVRTYSEDKVELHKWGPLRGALKMVLLDTALLAVRRTCDDPTASKVRILSVADIRNVIQRHVALRVKQGDSPSTPALVEKALSYHAQPHHHIDSRGRPLDPTLEHNQVAPSSVAVGSAAHPPSAAVSLVA
jgi:hypothetical protein